MPRLPGEQALYYVMGSIAFFLFTVNVVVFDIVALYMAS